MIDRNARNSMAEATRHYLAGLSTNFVFDDTIFDLKSDDPAIKAIRDNLWLIYDDIRKHKHEGKWKVSEEQREIIMRIIMFLKSDIEFRWPTVPGWYEGFRPLIWLFTFSVGTRSLDRRFEIKDDKNVWPFRNHDEIQVAKDEPKYLATAT